MAAPPTAVPKIVSLRLELEKTRTNHINRDQKRLPKRKTAGSEGYPKRVEQKPTLAMIRSLVPEQRRAEAATRTCSRKEIRSGYPSTLLLPVIRSGYPSKGGTPGLKEGAEAATRTNHTNRDQKPPWPTQSFLEKTASQSSQEQEQEDKRKSKRPRDRSTSLYAIDRLGRRSYPPMFVFTKTRRRQSPQRSGV